MMTHWRKCIVCMVFAIGAPCAATAEEAAPAREVSSGETQQEAGLLLPAVQKVRSAQATSSSQAAPGQVQAAPQKGIEPDEIDRDNRAQNRSRARATRKLSTQQMMRKLKPQRATTKPPAGAGAGAGKANLQAKPDPQKYEIADCGTEASPMICCHHEQGDGSSCNLFKILCENAGGKAQGDGESAACSDW